MPIEVDFAGNTVWQCSTSVCGGTHNFTHHASKLSNGDYALIEYTTTNNVQSPVFREVNASNQVVWSLDWKTLIPPPAGATGDWCHANAITIDIANNAVYANCRWIGLLKTTYQNPTKQWLLQGSYDAKYALGDFTFSGSQFSDTHDPEVHSDGTFCFYDNGGYSSTASTGGTTATYHSRAVEYQVDENAKTATLIWEFPGKFSVPDEQLVQPLLGRRRSAAERQLPGHRRDPQPHRREPRLRGHPERRQGRLGVPLPARLRRLPLGPHHAPADSRADAVTAVPSPVAAGVAGSRVIGSDFDAGWLLPTATAATGTSTFVSG
jgi:hypothetical protein